MKPKKFNKKLSLNKKTIANLNTNHMGIVQAGHDETSAICPYTDCGCVTGRVTFCGDTCPATGCGATCATAGATCNTCHATCPAGCTIKGTCPWQCPEIPTC
jgi:hypothetical protein